MRDDAAWNFVEMGEGGRFKISHINADSVMDVEIVVFADFSGQITNDAGEFFEFKDLRTLIEAGDVIKRFMTERYGDYPR